MENIVTVNMNDNEVIDQMKLDGIYDVFMAQINRIELKPDTIITGKFVIKGKVKFITYHHRANDRGFVMITVDTHCPAMAQAIVEIVEKSLEASYTGPVKPLYINDLLMRN